MIPDSLQQLIHRFKTLPGVGSKTAQRYALHLLERDRERAHELHSALGTALNKLIHCPICGILQDISQSCLLCNNPHRDAKLVLVVPSFFDVLHFEELQCFSGMYHVLGGHLSPLNDIGPDNLRLKELHKRVEQNTIQEIILALSPTLEGEATAYFIGQLLKGYPITLTRLATGIPVGGDLERIDAHTLALSIQQRLHYKNS